jgi:hypothetical protein
LRSDVPGAVDVRGTPRRPADPDMPKVGDEVAVARDAAAAGRPAAWRWSSHDIPRCRGPSGVAEQVVHRAPLRGCPRSRRRRGVVFLSSGRLLSDHEGIAVGGHHDRAGSMIDEVSGQRARGPSTRDAHRGAAQPPGAQPPQTPEVGRPRSRP